ncbi:hypothetical protein V6N13_093200 [Hibiscus sabdariffa]
MIVTTLRGAFLKPLTILGGGIPQASMIVTILRGAFLKPCNDLERGIPQASFIDIIEKIASLGKARRQGGTKFNNCSTQICAILVLSIGTSMVVSVPIPLWKFVYRCSPIGTGLGIGTLFRVSVPFDTGIGTTPLGTGTGSLKQLLESLEA